MINNNYISGQKLLCGSYTQFTVYGKNNFVRNGRYSKHPKLGAVVYFYSSALKRVAHVGWVIFIEKLSPMRYKIKTIEGNTSPHDGIERNGGCVAIKTYIFNVDDVGGTNPINGFGDPCYGEDTCSVEELIEVAKKEIGYTEKKSNTDLFDKTKNVGSNNYTKYGEWYGNNGVYWCQQFVSWCAYEACRIHKIKNRSGWIETLDGWVYRVNGEPLKNVWENIGGKWYVFNDAGIAITGWFMSGDDWYYLNPDDCAMISGQWIEYKNQWYYLSGSGVMVKNAYVKSTNSDIYYWLDTHGVYMPEKTTTNPDLYNHELAA